MRCISSIVYMWLIFQVLECGDVCHVLLLKFGLFQLLSKRVGLFYTPPLLQVSISIVNMM